jgi:hypothetical protein
MLWYYFVSFLEKMNHIEIQRFTDIPFAATWLDIDK